MDIWEYIIRETLKYVNKMLEERKIPFGFNEDYYVKVIREEIENGCKESD